MHKSDNVEKTVSMLFTFQETYLHFMGMEMMGSSRDKTVGQFLLYTTKPKSHHTQLSSKGILDLFQTFLEDLGTC